MFGSKAALAAGIVCAQMAGLAMGAGGENEPSRTSRASVRVELPGRVDSLFGRRSGWHREAPVPMPLPHREAPRAITAVCEEVELGDHSAKVTVELWRECGELHARVVFGGGHACTIDPERVTLRFKDGKRSWNMPLEAGRRDRAVYESCDGVRVDDCGSLKVELRVTGEHDFDKVSWERIRVP